MLRCRRFDEGYNTPFEGAPHVHWLDYTPWRGLAEHCTDRLACVSEYNFEASLPTRPIFGFVAYCDDK